MSVLVVNAGSSSVKYALVVDKALYDVAYWWVLPGKGEIHRIPPAWVERVDSSPFEAGKYRVTGKTFEDSLRIAEHLIASERATTAAPSAPVTSSPSPAQSASTPTAAPSPARRSS